MAKECQNLLNPISKLPDYLYILFIFYFYSFEINLKNILIKNKRYAKTFFRMQSRYAVFNDQSVCTFVRSKNERPILRPALRKIPKYMTRCINTLRHTYTLYY